MEELRAPICATTEEALQSEAFRKGVRIVAESQAYAADRILALLKGALALPENPRGAQSPDELDLGAGVMPEKDRALLRNFLSHPGVVAAGDELLERTEFIFRLGQARKERQTGYGKRTTVAPDEKALGSFLSLIQDEDGKGDCSHLIRALLRRIPNPAEIEEIKRNILNGEKEPAF